MPIGIVAATITAMICPCQPIRSSRAISDTPIKLLAPLNHWTTFDSRSVPLNSCNWVIANSAHGAMCSWRSIGVA